MSNSANESSEVESSKQINSSEATAHQSTRHSDDSEFPFLRWLPRIEIGMIVLLGAGLAWQLIALSWYEIELNRKIVRLGQTKAEKIHTKLTKYVEEIELLTARFANELEARNIHSEELLKQLKQRSRQHEFLLGFTVAYVPDEAEDDPQQYAPFFDNRSGEIEDLTQLYDYTEESETSKWYCECLQAESGVWVSGYGDGAATHYVGYSVPFYQRDTQTGERKIQGVVNASVSLQDLNRSLNRKFIGSLGGAVLMNEQGTLLAHPRFDYVSGDRTLRTFAEEVGSEELLRANQEMLAGNSGNVSVKMHRLANFRSDQSGWFFYRPIERPNWSLGVGIMANELDYGHNERRRRQILIVLTIAAFALFLTALICRVHQLKTQQLWIFSFLTSVYLATSIGIIWYLTTTFGLFVSQASTEEPHESRIINIEGLNTFLEQWRQEANELREPRSEVVPTGIYVRSLEFTNANNIQVSGFLWQRYRLGSQDHLARGISFPDVAPDPGSLTLTQTHQEKNGEFEELGWEFRVTLRQKFDYGAYPFDRQTIAIRLKNADRFQDVVLVPELDRYQLINSQTLPGVREELVLPGWRVMGSYFGYQREDYNFRLTKNSFTDQTRVPVMQFNVVVQRNFLTPFLSHIIPILVVMILLHGILISSSIDEGKQESSGFSAFGVLETSGAFFFAIVLMHIDLRARLNLDIVTYLECLYISGYLALISVALNALAFITTDEFAIFEYRDNLLAKVFYWPLFLLLLLAVTLWTLY